MQSFCCNRVQEKLEVIRYICIDDDCQSISVCCEFCKQETHQNHQQDCLFLKNIINKFLEEYTHNYAQVIQEIQVIEIIFKESINNFQNYLKDIFKTSIDNDEMIYNLEYAHLRKSQVKYFIQALQQLKQQINLLKQISSQFENKNAVTLQDISQCEIEINKIKQQQSKQTQILSQINVQLIDKKQQQQQKQQTISEIKVQEQQIQRKIIFLDNDEEQEIQEELENQSKIEDQPHQILNNKLQKQSQLQDSQESIIEINKLSQMHQNSSNINFGFKGFQNFISQAQNIFQKNQQQRIHEIVNKPLQYFCNPKGKNVFASDGKNVKIYDVIPFQGVQASFCPQKLYDVFKTKEINPDGLYEFVIKDKIHQNVLVQIDDYIPYIIDGRLLLSQNNCICFTMLMKAIAHIFGGYQIFQSQQKVQFVIEIFQIGYVIFGTESDNFSEQIRNEIAAYSLILFHLKLENQFKVIQILDLINLINLFEEETILFKLRSAYGRDVYQGEWGFQSPYWIDDLKDKLNVSNEDDGIFYMDFISFIQEPKMIYSLRINQQLSAYQRFFLKR